MGRKCNVFSCPSDSRREEDHGVTFHKIPHHTDLRPKWLQLCKIPEERKNVKVIYVCSRHFLKADFCNFKGTKYMLKQGALPSVFPWNPPSSSNTESEVLSRKNKKVITEADSTVEAVLESEPVKSEIKELEKEETAQADAQKGQHSMQIVVPDKSSTSVALNEDSFKIKEDMFVNKEAKSDVITSILPPSSEYAGVIDFTPGNRIEANDFHDRWYSAQIVEVDYDENEVFIHFEKCPNRGDEWIPMDSSRLRPLQANRPETYEIDEKCLATWTDGKKFPATVKRILDKDTYEVLFDDGYIKTLKLGKLSKFKKEYLKDLKRIPPAHTAPLFEPVVGSKQERRDRKRKINVAELFNKKRHRHDDSFGKPENVHDEERYVHEHPSSQLGGSSDPYDEEEWTCNWLNGVPVGEESMIDCMDGRRPSVIVPDNRLPPGWIKHLSKRMYGNSAGKWDVFIFNPEGRKFRNKHEIKLYLEENKLDYSIEIFDFGLHLYRARKLGLYEVTDPEALAASAPKPVPRHEAMRKSKELAKRAKISTPKLGSPSMMPATPEVAHSGGEDTEEDELVGGSLKIIHENDSYKCPIEGCGKNFRRENLAQMHIKHYHPEYTKLLGSTPNVADLAYARTVKESIEEITPKVRSIPPTIDKPYKIETTPKPKSTIKVLTPKVPPKLDEYDPKKSDKMPLTHMPRPATKDAEIIRLLNSDPKSKGIDSIFEPSPPKLDYFPKLDSDTPKEVKYPEKLKELLNKPDLVNKKDEITPNRPSGIKTILPVIRVQEELKTEPPELGLDPTKPHLNIRYSERSRLGRKRQSSEMEINRKRRQSMKYDTDDYSDYYEADSISQDSFVVKKPIPETTVATESPQVIIEEGEVIRLVHMKREEIINCTCGITEEDGLMIQCELCLCWQHGYCNSITKESQVPEKYICYICQNPLKMRTSTKYMHDQDWLKQGTLPTASYHSKDVNTLSKRYEKLRKSHELTGNLLELNDYIHNLRIKLNIAETKDHPKLYLWAKPWDKTAPDISLNLLKKQDEIKEPPIPESSQSSSTSDHSYIKGSMFGDVALQSMLVPANQDIKPIMPDDMKIKSQSELISILEEGNDDKMEKETDYPKVDLNPMISSTFQGKDEKKEDKEDTLNTITGGLLGSGSLDLQLSQTDLDRLSTLAQLSEVATPQPNVPQPEAAIDSGDCKMNLLEHIDYYQNLVNDKLNAIENAISALEGDETCPVDEESVEEIPRTKQTIQMLLRDLSTMRQIASISQ